jgi:gliding motility-associated-like protein
VISHYWDWGDGYYHTGNDTLVEYSFSGTGIFQVKLKVTTDQGCETETTKQIRVIPYPEAMFSVYRNCVSHSIQLTDISTGIDLATRSWDFGTAPVTAAFLNQQQPEAVFHAAGQFPVRLIITNQYGCTDTLLGHVEIHNPPVAAFTNETPCQDAGIIFSDQSIPSDTLLYDFEWNVESSTGNAQTHHGSPALIEFDQVTNYTVSLITTDYYGCTDTVSSLIEVKPKPVCAFGFTENAGNIRGKLQFENQTTGASGYVWDFGNSITSTLPEPDIKYDNEGEYTIILIATSVDGCTDTATKSYYYMPGLWLPNAFTPDNDGLNDIFRPVTQRNTLDPYQLLIFDRWGQLIFKSSNPADGWDGTCNGEPCQTGNYKYVVHFREGDDTDSGSATLRGMVSLIR